MNSEKSLKPLKSQDLSSQPTKNALKKTFNWELSCQLMTIPESTSFGKEPIKWLRLIQSKDTNKNIPEQIPSHNFRISIIKDMLKSISAPFASSAKMEASKLLKSSTKEKISTKLSSILKSKTKSSLSPISD